VSLPLLVQDRGDDDGSDFGGQLGSRNFLGALGLDQPCVYAIENHARKSGDFAALPLSRRTVPGLASLPTVRVMRVRLERCAVRKLQDRNLAAVRRRGREPRFGRG